MLLQLQRYEYDIHVVYKPGKQMYVADTLSRAPLPEIEHCLDEDVAFM